MFDFNQQLQNLGRMSMEQFQGIKDSGVNAITSLGKMGIDAFNKIKDGNVININNPKPKLTAEISAYTASPDETDSRPFETAMQTKAREGIVATNNRDLLGKKVKVGDTVYTVEDVMNKRYRDAFKKTGKVMFDIFMNDKNKALQFGRQHLPFELLN